MTQFKQLLFALLLLCLGTTAFAQVKVGNNPTTINASSVLEVESTNKGFLPPRMTQAQRDAIASPAQGLVIYNTTVPCLQVNDGTPAVPVWNCISGVPAGPNASTNGTGIVSAYGGAGCTGSGTINGTMTQGVAVSGVTMSLYANVTTLGTYNLSAAQNGVTFTGSGTFTTLGCQLVTLTASGTPTAAGPFTWCTNTTPQGCSPATVQSAAPSGTVTALNCAGVTLSPAGYNPNGTAYSGTASVPYTGGNGGSYAAGSVASTGVTGFTATWAAGTLATGAGSISITITGSSTTSGVASFPITIGGQSCTITLGGCGVYLLSIAGNTFKPFLCHNLGADPSLDPHTPVMGLHGALIQWGRRGPNTTGNSVVDWQTAANTTNFAAAPTASNPNVGPIAGWSNVVASTNAWVTQAGNKTADDPCPAGYKVPTLLEWQEIGASMSVTRLGSFAGGNTNYGSAMQLYYFNINNVTLTLPAAGQMSFNGPNGTNITRGYWGNYWSSTEDPTSSGTSAYNFFFDPTTELPGHSYGKLNGMSIRCIAQ